MKQAVIALFADMVRLANQGVNTTGGPQPSVEFAFAFHVSEEGDDGLLHPDERLGRESVLSHRSGSAVLP